MPQCYIIYAGFEIQLLHVIHEAVLKSDRDSRGTVRIPI